MKWRKSTHVTVGQRAIHHGRLNGFSLRVIEWGATLVAEVTTKRPDDGGEVRLAEKRVDARGGGGNQPGIDRQVQGLKDWCERQAFKCAGGRG